MRANFNRTDRIAALLRREIGALVHDAVREKLVPSVSVSDVEVTRDLAHATVYVTALLGDQGIPAVKALNEAAWEFRRELSQRVELRAVPALHFKYDDSVDRGQRIETLLRDSEELVPPLPDPSAPEIRAARIAAELAENPPVPRAKRGKKKSSGKSSARKKRSD